MAFPEIGLLAVLKLSGFEKETRQYQRTLRDMERLTKQTAASITRSGGRIARSADDVMRLSSAFQELTTGITTGMNAFERTAGFGVGVRASDELTQAFSELGRGAEVNVDLFDKLGYAGVSMGQALHIAAGHVQFNEEAFNNLTAAGIGVQDAVGAATGQIQFSMGAFNMLTDAGMDANQAFEKVASASAVLGQRVTILGRSFSVATIAATSFVAVMTVILKTTQDAIEEYAKLAEATRRVHYQTGMLADEASAWVLMSEAMGISAATSQRALTSFLGKVGDLRREIILGEEGTSDFAVAMRSLGVDIIDQGDKLKSTQQLLAEVNEAFRDYGAGVQTATWAQDLFGYSGRFLLPILVSEKRSLADVQEYAERVGATIKIEDLPAYEDWLNATIDLDLAQQGLKNTLASELLPVLTDIKKAWADILGFVGRVIRDQQNQERMEQLLAKAYADGNVRLAERLQATIDVLYGAEQLAHAEAELKQQRDAETQAAAQAAEAERELQKQREETLLQLGELKSKLQTKLLDIERDASERYNAIFVDRMRDAMERMLRLTWKMDDLRADLDEKLSNIEQDFADRWNEILVNRARDAFENQLRTFWRLIDMQRDYEQSRQDVMRDYAEREADLCEDTRKRIEDLEEDAQERREDLERDHQERLAKIRQDYLDTVQEAARKNDAVAVARAMRERAREQRDERKRYTEEQRDLAESLTKKREDLDEDRREREADTQRELQRALRRLEENYQRQRDKLAIQLERDRQLREMHYRWEQEDFEAARQKQLDAAQEWYDKQIIDLEQAQERERILNEMHYQQQLDDLALARKAQRDEANRQYGLDRDELAEQLRMTGVQLEDAYADWILQAGLAAAEAAAAIATVWQSEITRYQQYLPYGPSGEITRYQQYQQPQPALSPEIERYRQYLPQAPIGWGTPLARMAEGGIIHATSPTTVMFGEAGPETGFFVPGGASSLNVQHNFGGMTHDFRGLPGGLNTQQVEQIVYGAITKVARDIVVPRA